MPLPSQQGPAKQKSNRKSVHHRKSRQRERERRERERKKERIMHILTCSGPSSLSTEQQNTPAHAKTVSAAVQLQ
jgi:hypothetical protein